MPNPNDQIQWHTFPPEKHTIAAIGYDAKRWELHIHFRGSPEMNKFADTGKFFDVPYAVFGDFIRAESPGKFYILNIKKQYRSDRSDLAA